MSGLMETDPVLMQDSGSGSNIEVPLNVNRHRTISAYPQRIAKSSVANRAHPSSKMEDDFGPFWNFCFVMVSLSGCYRPRKPLIASCGPEECSRGGDKTGKSSFCWLHFNEWGKIILKYRAPHRHFLSLDKYGCYCHCCYWATGQSDDGSRVANFKTMQLVWPNSLTSVSP